MKNEKISFVFFGSGPVAAASLQLLMNTFTIEAVITKPTTEHEMKAVCGSTPVHCVKNRAELDTLINTQKFSSTVAVLIDFGIIVSQYVIDSFAHGIVNSHFSLLPELRGADPISFAILEGKNTTGVSLMLLVQAMDEGPLLAQRTMQITESMNTLELTDSLVALSAELLTEFLPKWVHGHITAHPQEEATIAQTKQPSYTRKLQKSDGVIDWDKPAVSLHREIRAFAGWPKSQTVFGPITCTISETSILQQQGTAGELFIQDKKLCVYCGTDSLIIEKLKPAGKKEMDSSSFLAGYKSRLPL